MMKWLLSLLILAFSTSAFSAIIEASLTSAQKLEITEYVNVYRRIHGAPDLSWDDDIMNDIAQPWATALATDTGVSMEHTSSTSTPSNNGEWGENLAWFQGHSHDVMARMKASVDLWYDEVNCMDWTDPEPSNSGHTCVVGHFTCLVWVASSRQGMGYAYNDVTNEINVNQNVQSTCNYVGQYAANVLPAITPTAAPTTFIERSTSGTGTVVAAAIIVFFFLLLVWCQHPFLIDEMNRRPHIEKDGASVSNIIPAPAENSKTGEYTGWQGQPLWYWSEWCFILGFSTRDCIWWYIRASLGAETACCKVLHDKYDGRSSSKVDMEVAGEEEVTTTKRTFLNQLTACIALWCRATKACVLDFWQESNEEIDHNEERKEGKSWLARLCASLMLCGIFYATTFCQTCTRWCSKLKRCCQHYTTVAPL